MDRYVCIHGHFYQPPRENPWLEQIELQDSANPYHDWNERITYECYEPNIASRIMENGKIIRIVNNYEGISFNFGPTLLSWLKTKNPEVYKDILKADKKSAEKFNGHGSALAQAYNHMIMPLANKRDKETQVIWGIRDFERRFKRKPEGMWLPETAVDTETLEVLAEHEIKFTILAPGQAAAIRKTGTEKWTELNGNQVDPKKPYLCNLPSGKSIVLFFYDGPVSHDLAFNSLLKDGKDFADRLLGVFDRKTSQPQLVHIATDGESYGHHHRHGDMALAFCLHFINKYKKADLINYAAFLEKHPPEFEVQIHEGTSWSCAHGVERWRSNCGCKATDDPKITQEWRGPLRKALDWLRDQAEPIYTEGLAKYKLDPWEIRNRYIDVILDRSDENIDAFIGEHFGNITGEEKTHLLQLLEIQRNAMLMYTSCGWFFNDISGIETIQVMAYAARVVQLVEKVSDKELENVFIELLEDIPGNYPEASNGRVVYEEHIQPGIIDLRRVAGHFAVASLYIGHEEVSSYGAYRLIQKNTEELEAGKQILKGGEIEVYSRITQEQKSFKYLVLNLGGHNILGGVCESGYLNDFNKAYREISDAFNKNKINEIILKLDQHFGNHDHSFWHLFKDKQREIISLLLKERLDAIEGAFRLLFNNNYSLMQMINQFKMPMPDAFSFPGEFILNAEIRKNLQEEEINLDELSNHLKEIDRFSFDIDIKTTVLHMQKVVNKLLSRIEGNKSDVEILKKLNAFLELIRNYRIELDLWKAQNLYYLAGKSHYDRFYQQSITGNPEASAWVRAFNTTGSYLNIKIA
ncbi:MAG: DUF3536 domain-containing protein [Bacteroidales bacterium]|nr:DUF3536 domain-containing protein [Bacteroidales bacterium]MCF8377263.1 DUF3536 domain-containing protein [Bacteroidales bacterium]MCF8401115.1 DUF3536 domain-containing protein [Bacteroidales bacterium]